ncbi:MAG: hypothetical protein NTY68_00470 [Candidatus Micrarchaeota archaeon]|nr:hypothetical protein [Candidatus Micrarchaeota archaeon]
MKLESMEVLFIEAKKASGRPPEMIDSRIDMRNAEVDAGNLAVEFVYSASYATDGSYIRMGGRALFSGPEAKAAADEWKKSKRISGKPGEDIINSINYGSSLNSVLVARVLNIVPPLAPPPIAFEKK